MANELNREDNLTPFTFKEWVRENRLIEEEFQTIEYQKYLNNWYCEFYDEDANKAQLQEDYLQVLKRLSLIFRNDPEFKRIGKINFENVDEVKALLPLFVSKMKQLAIYYIAKRESIKDSKIRYNVIGSTQGLEKILYQYLLKEFTLHSEYSTLIANEDVLTNMKTLSSVDKQFCVEVEELWNVNSC